MFSPTLRSLALLTAGDRYKFALLTIARILVSFLDVAGLVALGVLGTLLAGELGDGGASGFIGFDLSDFDNTSLLSFLLLVGVFFIGKSFLGGALLSVQLRFLTRVEASAASRLIRYLHSGPITRIQDITDGKVLWALNQGSQVATSGLLLTSATFIAESTLLVLILVLFLIVDPSAAVAIFFFFGIVVFLFQWLVKARLAKIGNQLTATVVESTNSARDLTVAFREISVLSRRNFFFSRFDSARKDFALFSNQQVFLLALPRYVVETALMIGVLALVAWQAGRGDLPESLPTIAVFLAGGVRMMAAILPLQNAITSLGYAGPQAEPVLDLMEHFSEGETLEEQEGALVNLPDEYAIRNAGVSIDVTGLTFSYPSAETPAVNGITMSVSPGSYTAIVGPSGAGKSTLADLLLGVHVPTAGTISLDGQTPQTLRASSPGVVSYVPQSPGMVAGTIAQNVALGIPDGDIDRDRVREVLTMAELVQFVDSQPYGLDTDLGPRSDALSGGQRQRLGLARALYTEPRLVILDEATSALDASTEASISDMIRQIGKQVTLIVIAHRLSTIQDADKVIVVDGGRVIEHGTFPEVRKAVPMIEEYVRLMSFHEHDESQGQ